MADATVSLCATLFAWPRPCASIERNKNVPALPEVAGPNMKGSPDG